MSNAPPTLQAPLRIESATDQAPVSSIISHSMPHTQVYHVCCGKCQATTAHDVATDAMRMVCPACGHRLTLPGAIYHECPSCQVVGEYRHILAGHSTACSGCGRALVLPPVQGRARHHYQRKHTRRHASRHDHTLAFSDSAEQSLILVAAAIATLIFVIILSVT